MANTFVLPMQADLCPELPIEMGSKNEGVGRWVPDEKHTLLAKMIDGTRGARRKWPERVFIDPFCGPGRVQVKGEDFTRPGGAVVAWLQSQASGVPFTQLLVGDLDEGRAIACGRRLAVSGAPARSFAGPAVTTVGQMIPMVPRGALALAYVDPYNLQFLSFEIIRQLARLPRIDFAVHFSTMDLQRNADMELDEDRARFDDAAPGWRDAPAVKTASKGELKLAFFHYWTSLVVGLGFTFSKEMPLVRGSRNEPLYRLVFFSRNAFPNKIWDDVARSPNLEFGF